MLLNALIGRRVLGADIDVDKSEGKKIQNGYKIE